MPKSSLLFVFCCLFISTFHLQRSQNLVVFGFLCFPHFTSKSPKIPGVTGFSVFFPHFTSNRPKILFCSKKTLEKRTPMRARYDIISAVRFLMACLIWRITDPCRTDVEVTRFGKACLGCCYREPGTLSL